MADSKTKGRKQSIKKEAKITSLNTAIKEIKKEKDENLSLEEEVEEYDSPSELSSSRGLDSGVLESGEVQEGPTEVDIRTPGEENQAAVKVYGSGDDTSKIYGVQATEQERLSYATSSGRISEGGLKMDISRSFAVPTNPGAMEAHHEDSGLHTNDLEENKNKRYDPVHDRKAKRYAWEV